MKKIIIAITLVSILSLIGFGVVMAQENTPEVPTFQNCPNCLFEENGLSGNQIMREYMNAAWAKVLGISLRQYDEYLQAGMTHYDIAEELDIELDTLPELMVSARLEAIEIAYADGTISLEQYQFFMERAELGVGFGSGMGHGRGFGHTRGNGFGQFGGTSRNGIECPNYQQGPTE